MLLSSSGYSFSEIFLWAEMFFDSILHLDDFFFKFRSFDFHLSPIADKILELFGIELFIFEGSIVHMLLGVGLPTFLTIRMLKFFLDIFL